MKLDASAVLSLNPGDRIEVRTPYGRKYRLTVTVVMVHDPAKLPHLAAERRGWVIAEGGRGASYSIEPWVDGNISIYAGRHVPTRTDRVTVTRLTA